MRAAFRVGSLVLGVGLAAGATCGPPPDPDGTVIGSQPVELGQWRRDGVDCGRSAGDCADWMHFEVQGEGTLRFDLAKIEDDQPAPSFELVFAAASGRPIESVPNGGQTRLRMVQKVRPGTYTAAVRLPEESGRMDYELRITFRPKQVVMPTQYDQVRASVLEIESRDDGGEAVLIDKGSSAGIGPGQRGRLLEGGAKIAEIEILDVYPDGSRALVRGSLGAAITPSTIAEVDVPQ